MGRNINSSKLTKSKILEKVSQITIFSTYFNISTELIQYCIDSGELICSPIRNDVHPTCGFKYDNRGKLKFKDFGGLFWGDCFDAVAHVLSGIYNYQYDISKKEDFIKVLRHITFTFKDIFYGQEKDSNLIESIKKGIVNVKKSKPIIELVVREWNKYDEDYWSQFGVSLRFLNLNFIHPVEQYYINRKANPEPKYYYKISDPCYGYVLGQDRNGIYNIKLYFPKRTKGTTRFVTNCNHLEGIYNLNDTDYDIIILTKSTKDRLSLGESLMKPFLYGGTEIKKIGVINVPHETYRLRLNEYDWLKSKLTDNGKIVSLMDNDRTGKLEASYLRDTYKIIPLLIPKQYKAKDFSELVANNKHSDVIKLIKETINYMENYEETKSNKSVWNKEENDSLPY